MSGPFPIIFTVGLNDPYFDGNNDYLSKTTALSGVSDGTEFLFSFHIKGAGAAGSYVLGQRENPGTIEFGIQASSNISGFMLRPAEGLASFTFTSTGAVLADELWHHVLISRNGATLQIYIDNVDRTGMLTTHGDTLQYSFPDLAIQAGRANGANKNVGCLQEFWGDFGVSLDLSVAANRAKFNYGTLGANGETPTGTTPALFFRGGPTDFPTNLGNGGAFALNGELGLCSLNRSTT